jgi:serine protease Do
LLVGDVVMKVDDHPVNEAEELRYVLATLPVGEKATLAVNHEGAPRTLQLTLEPPPETPARQTTLLSGRQPLAGVTVSNLNPAVADELGLQYEEPGVVITKVDPNSFGARVGVQPTDIVLAINDDAVKSVADLQRVLAKSVARWTVTLSRGGHAIQFTVGG